MTTAPLADDVTQLLLRLETDLRYRGSQISIRATQLLDKYKPRTAARPGDVWRLACGCVKLRADETHWQALRRAHIDPETQHVVCSLDLAEATLLMRNGEVVKS